MSEVEQNQWFDREIKDHEPQLRSYLRKKFPTLDDVDDVIQEAYARLLKAKEQRKIHEPKAFLFTIARNTVYDLFRRRKVVQFESLTHFSDSFVVDNTTDIEESVCRRDEIDLLIRAVESLPKRCRQVMTLRLIYGYSYKEIAGELDISPHTVKVQLAKGMRRSTDFLSRHSD